VRGRRRPVLAALALVGSAALASCSAEADVTDTPPAPTPRASLGSSAAPREKCSDGAVRSASYRPLPLSDRSTGLLGEIVKRGRLVVGVSADSYLLGALKPGSVDQFEGFDIDVAHEVARDLLGDPNKVTFKVITAADRPGAVNAGAANNGVDLVARNYTMTCDRWSAVNFSAVYFQAAQDTLVPTSAAQKSLKQLGTDKKVVCAPTSSTSLDALPRLAPGAVPYGADQHTACLALLQEGRVDAITGDNTVLAGLNVQDPSTRVLKETLSSEPYGLASARAHPELVRYVNSVLKRMEDDGTWQRLYDKYFAKPLGPKKPPPLDTSKPLP
jgi:polar amino acid transport system substrate-binding protein